MNENIKQRWIRFASHFTDKTASIDTVWNWIESAYTEPHRFYHTLDHIADCLEQLFWAEIGHIYEGDDFRAIEMALWFHDSVYQTDSQTNEEDSAKLAQNAMGVLGITNTEFRDKVTRLILASKHSDQEIIIDEEELFLDIDLSILGMRGGQYEQYEQNIRKEYGWVPYEVFCQKRIEILENFLARPRIFRSEIYRKTEGLARRNMKRSIDNLRNQLK